MFYICLICPNILNLISLMIATIFARATFKRN